MTFEEIKLRIDYFCKLSQENLLIYSLTESGLLDRLEAFQIPEFEYGGREVVCKRSLERILDSLMFICRAVEKGYQLNLQSLRILLTGLLALESSQDARLRAAPFVKPYLFFEAQAVYFQYLCAPRSSELVRLSADIPILLTAFYKRQDARERLRMIGERGKPEILYAQPLITFRGQGLVTDRLIADSMSQLSLELLLWEELERLT